MIHSSGQILTGRAAKQITDAISNTPDEQGFYRSAYKAVCLPTGDDVPKDTSGAFKESDVYGTWIVEAAEGKEDQFLGVVGDDTSPEANLTATLDNRQPVLDYGANRTLMPGDVCTIERNGMISVVAGADVTEGDLLILGANGTFKPKGAKDTANPLGRAYKSAKKGERFIAYIKGV